MRKLTLFLLSLFVLSACGNQSSDDAKSADDVQSVGDVTQSEIVTYSLSDVADHSTPDDCWIVLNNKVYDVSGFGTSGHGGGESVYEGCGKDATDLFETRPMGSGTPHSEKAREFLDNFYIGELDS